MPRTSQTFSTLLRGIIADSAEGTARAVARSVNVTPSQMSHWLAGKTRPGIEITLRFAHYSGSNASLLLRGAGHTAIATLIEESYGRPAQRRARALSQTDKQVQYFLRHLNAQEKRAVLCVLRYLADAASRRRAHQR
jgi:transcriptional regulator with XRE-family HTH domain